MAWPRRGSSPPQRGAAPTRGSGTRPQDTAGPPRVQAPSGPHPAQPGPARTHASGLDPRRGQARKQGSKKPDAIKRRALGSLRAGNRNQLHSPSARTGAPPHPLHLPEVRATQ